ncbi:MAG TPA: glycosyltransferase family 4 protein [Anaerolineales bacterium]
MINTGMLHFAGPPVVGGVESTIYHHARLLAEAGHRVTVVAGRGEKFQPEVAFHHIPEISSRHPDVLSAGNCLARGEVTEEFEQLREQLAQKLKPILGELDVCIVHNAITLHKNLPLTAALRCLSDEGVTRLIAWCHDFAWQDRLYTSDLHPGYPWDLLRTPWPDVRYVVVSNHRRVRLARLLGLAEAQIRVVTPGVDVDQFLKLEPLTHQLVESNNLLDAKPLMLLPARITRRKNIQFAIRITAALKNQYPGVALVVTGPPGPHNPKNIAYLQELKDLRQELEVDQKVHFLFEQGASGRPLHVPDAVIADLYSLADLLLFPSRREGFGIPILEAGLARLPVFAADIAPVRESAGQLAQVFDPDGDPAAVANAISGYLENDRAYKLRKRVLNQFTWRSIVRHKLIPIIEEGPRA